MSYPIGTILRRYEPFTEPERLHLNHVKVTGLSPVQQPSLAEWGGAGGESVVVETVEGFGSPESLPVAVGNREYETLFLPEADPLVTTTEQVTKPVTRLRAEAPEAVFQRAEREAAEMRARTIAEAPVVEAAAEPEVVVAATEPVEATPKPAAKAKPKAPK